MNSPESLYEAGEWNPLNRPAANESWTFPSSWTIMTLFPPSEPDQGLFSTPKFYGQETSNHQHAVA